MSLTIDPNIIYRTRSSNGEIIDDRRGTNGFGYDPVFYSYDLKKVFAEATPEEKNSVSHRGRALAKIIPLIK